jgi:hypothetical protein
MGDTMFAGGNDAHLSTFNRGNGARHGDFTDQHRTARVKSATAASTKAITLKRLRAKTTGVESTARQGAPR